MQSGAPLWDLPWDILLPHALPTAAVGGVLNDVGAALPTAAVVGSSPQPAAVVDWSLVGADWSVFGGLLYSSVVTTAPT